MVRLVTIAICCEDQEASCRDESEVRQPILCREAQRLIAHVVTPEVHRRTAGVEQFDKIIGRGSAADGQPFVNLNSSRGSDGLRNIRRAKGRLSQTPRSAETKAPNRQIRQSRPACNL